jgi:hypothetical protein
MPERERICQVSLAMWDDENSGNPTYSGSFRYLGVQQQMPLSEIDGLEAVTEVYLRSLLTVKLEDEKTFTVNAISADSDFVRVFPLQAAEGTLDLKAYGNAIISQSLARKLFPGESAVGRTFTMDNDLHTVTGVFREPSTKSTYHFDLVNNSNREGWFNNTLAVSFVKLKEGWSREQFNKQQTKKKIFDDAIKDMVLKNQSNTLNSRRSDSLYQEIESIANRSLTPLERDQVTSWIKSGASDGMIKEACERSLTKAGNISFKTADRLILDMQRSQSRKTVGASMVNEDTKQREELREFLLNTDWTYHGKK